MPIPWSPCVEICGSKTVWVWVPVFKQKRHLSETSATETWNLNGIVPYLSSFEHVCVYISFVNRMKFNHIHRLLWLIDSVLVNELLNSNPVYLPAFLFRHLLCCHTIAAVPRRMFLPNWAEWLLLVACRPLAVCDVHSCFRIFGWSSRFKIVSLSYPLVN